MLDLLRMRTFNALGQLSPQQLAAERGFKVGVFIQRKGDKTLAKIHSFKDSLVIVEMEDGPLSGKAQFPVETLVSGKWKVSEAKATPEDVADFMSVVPRKSHELHIQTIKGMILKAMWDLESTHEKAYGKLKIQLKPRKGVFVTQQFSKGSLKLVPTSCKIEGIQHGDKGYDDRTGLCLGRWNIDNSVYKKSGYVFYVHPMYVPTDKPDKAFVNPFFFVKPTPFAEDANVELHPQPFSPEVFNKDGKIPVIRNTVALKAGDELVVYIPQTKPDEPEELQPVVPSKRQRTKKGADS